MSLQQQQYKANGAPLLGADVTRLLNDPQSPLYKEYLASLELSILCHKIAEKEAYIITLENIQRRNAEKDAYIESKLKESKEELESLKQQYLTQQLAAQAKLREEATGHQTVSKDAVLPELTQFVYHISQATNLANQINQQQAAINQIQVAQQNVTHDFQNYLDNEVAQLKQRIAANEIIVQGHVIELNDEEVNRVADIYQNQKLPSDVINHCELTYYKELLDRISNEKYEELQNKRIENGEDITEEDKLFDKVNAAQYAYEVTNRSPSQASQTYIKLMHEIRNCEAFSLLKEKISDAFLSDIKLAKMITESLFPTKPLMEKFTKYNNERVSNEAKEAHYQAYQARLTQELTEEQGKAKQNLSNIKLYLSQNEETKSLLQKLENSIKDIVKDSITSDLLKVYGP